MPRINTSCNFDWLSHKDFSIREFDFSNANFVFSNDPLPLIHTRMCVDPTERRHKTRGEPRLG